MEAPVAAYTGLALTSPTPPAEVVGRAEWASVNLDTLSHMLDPVAERLDERLGFAGPLAGALRVGASATLAAEAGLVMGYMSSRVLGQYDVSLLGAETRPAPPVRRAEPRRRGARPRGGRRVVRALDLRPRAHARLPVPGRAVAARAPERAAAPSTCARSRCGSRRARPAGCRRCRTRAARGGVPRRRARGAGADRPNSGH